MQQKLSFDHLLSSNQISKDDISIIFDLSQKYHNEFGQSKAQKDRKSLHDCQDYILATLFFEPSTRTRFSFESAMQKLNGKIISLEQGLFSSIKKGESLEDMGRVFSKYSDLVVIRHPEMDSAKKFSKYSSIPVINGGDGANEHPTQSLTDLYTIKQTKNRLDNLVIGIVGDLKYSRTAYSLIKLLSLYPNNEFILISQEIARLKDSHKEKLLNNNINLRETINIEDEIANLDVLYAVRTQKERFASEDEYKKVNGKYLINNNLLKKAKKDLTIMHPLPRLDEIDTEIDSDQRSKYFFQAEMAVFVRMALINLMKDHKVEF